MYSILRYVINVKCKENETSQTNIDMEKISNFFFIAHRNINVQSVIVGMIYKNIFLSLYNKETNASQKKDY